MIERAEESTVLYWIYEFETDPVTAEELKTVTEQLNMTIDEFFQAALKYAIENPEQIKSAVRADDYEEKIRLVRCCPVHEGETEEQALMKAIQKEGEENEKACKYTENLEN